MANAEPIVAKIVNDQGKPMIALKSLSRDGDRVEIVGSLLGQWDTTMYMDPEELVNAIQIAMNSPELLSYVLDLPKIMRGQIASEGK